jgi:gamma-glutamylcyclotransferase (GGCT)/AIG2-like uncharacterized protein YtfP
MILLFVYGSLLKGLRMHYHLEDARFIDEACLKNAKLFDLGNYPALVLEGDGIVYGELYAVDRLILGNLDFVEGFEEDSSQSLYRRVLQEIKLKDGRSARAYVYVFNQCIPLSCVGIDGYYRDYVDVR